MEIRSYWNERAGDASTATTEDVHLRVLERETLIAQLKRLGCNENSRVIDLGCGDGQTIFAIAKAFGCEAHGQDYAEGMVELAKRRLKEHPVAKVSFSVGDIRKSGETFAGQTFDFVLTDRVLINLEKTDIQFDTITQIAKLVHKGGYYLCIENFVEGNDRLNAIRETFGLPPIQIRWHNHFFNEADFEAHARKHFAGIERIDFSSAYYLATRVVYSKMCAIENLKIDYLHPVHELSAKLPATGNFSPIVLYVLQR
ncbi:MAG: class I SAM-dependent methyltransferase [Beijerinckiaceae bacterium]